MLERIEYSDVKKYKRYIPFDLNTNSKLYFDGDLIHKIPHFKERDFLKIISMVDSLKLNELIEIKKLIYKNETIVGYSMKNYKEYKSLRKLKNRNFELKRTDCIKIIKCVEVLSNNNISFFDCQLSNILLNPKNNDMKICDIDGLTFNEEKTLNYSDLKKILCLILAYLYNIKEYDIRNVLLSTGIDNNKSFINKCCFDEKNLNIEKIYTIIYDIQKNFTINEKKDIINKSKQLCETGYSKYLRY